MEEFHPYAPIIQQNVLSLSIASASSPLVSALTMECKARNTKMDVGSVNPAPSMPTNAGTAPFLITVTLHAQLLKSV